MWVRVPIFLFLSCLAVVCHGCSHVASWGKWSACSEPCDVGNQRRDRAVSKEDDCPHSMEIMTCNEWPCSKKAATSGMAPSPMKKERDDAKTVTALNAQFAQQQSQLMQELQQEDELLSKDPDDPSVVEAEMQNAMEEQKQAEGMTGASQSVKTLDLQQVDYPAEYQAKSKRTLSGLRGFDKWTHHSGMP